jgi:hypothetical protein
VKAGGGDAELRLLTPVLAEAAQDLAELPAA